VSRYSVSRCPLSHQLLLQARTPSTTNPALGSTSDVVRDLTEFQVSGAEETIPEGFVFVITTMAMFFCSRAFLFAPQPGLMVMLS